MSVQNVIQIHPIIVEICESGLTANAGLHCDTVTFNSDVEIVDKIFVLKTF